MKSYLISKNRLKQITAVCSLILFSQTLQAKSEQYQVIELCAMSQNVLKDKMLVSMDVTYSNSEENLLEIVKEIDKQLAQLKKEKLSKKLQDKVISLESSWSNIKKKLEDPLLQNEALDLYTSFRSFDTECQSFTQESAGSTSDKKLLLANLNLQVQTLTALYVVKSWNLIDDATYGKAISETIKSYQSARTSLETLLKKEDLERLDKEFAALKFMTSSNSGRYMPVLANKKASAINDTITLMLEGK